MWAFRSQTPPHRSARHDSPKPSPRGVWGSPTGKQLVHLASKRPAQSLIRFSSWPLPLQPAQVFQSIPTGLADRKEKAAALDRDSADLPELCSQLHATGSRVGGLRGRSRIVSEIGSGRKLCANAKLTVTYSIAYSPPTVPRKTECLTYQRTPRSMACSSHRWMEQMACRRQRSFDSSQSAKAPAQGICDSPMSSFSTLSASSLAKRHLAQQVALWFIVGNRRCSLRL